MARLIVEIEIPGTEASEIRTNKNWYAQDIKGQIDPNKIIVDEGYLTRDLFDDSVFVFNLVKIEND